MNLTIEPFVVPDSPDDPAWQEYVTFSNRATERECGSSYLDQNALALHSRYANRTHHVTDAYLAFLDGVLVGTASLEYDRATSRDVEILVLTDPGDPRIQDALLAHLEDRARELGRSNAIVYVSSPVDFATLDEAELLRPASGFGGVMLDAPITQTMLGRGYALGQVERCSVYRRTTDPSALRERLDAASAVAGSDYEAVWWLGRAPDEYVDAYAHAISKMSTDIPHGELEVEEKTWDTSRVRAREARVELTGEQWAIAAIVHRPSGQIVAFNELVVPPDATQVTSNYGTIALAEHRGHRLGTIVKCLGLLRWLDFAPDSPAVVTFNAEENRYMLDVNESVGFAPVHWEGAWSKQP